MGASFAAGAKAEICKVISQKKCCAVAQAFGVLLYCNTFNQEQIKIVTESRDFAQTLPKLFRRAFGFGFDEIPGETFTGKCVFLIQKPDKLHHIMRAYGFEPNQTLSLHVNLSARRFSGGHFWPAAPLQTRRKAIIWKSPPRTRQWPGRALP